MENENMRSEVQNNPETDTAQDYISAIKEIKENSVDKQIYLKLKEENRRLLDAMVNGETISQDQQPVAPNIEELRNKLFSFKNQNMNNLEYVETALELRKALMEQGEIDPFVPYGEKIKPTDEDFEKADKVARVLQECVDYANGNPNTFVDEFNRRIV